MHDNLAVRSLQGNETTLDGTLDITLEMCRFHESVSMGSIVIPR